MHVSPHRSFKLNALPRLLKTAGWLVLCWLGLAYVLLPWMWESAEWQPSLPGAPPVTHTAADIPGDPLNLLIIGSKSELLQAMNASGWRAADALSLLSSLRIIGDTLLSQPYADAPVSNLYLFGRKEDLAFEKPVGQDPRQRHHVRFWQAPEQGPKGEQAWWGAATYDVGIGFSHTTGQVTHHIDGAVDAERDRLIESLKSAATIQTLRFEPGFQKPSGFNGGGDAWHSDGRLAVITLLHAAP